MKRFFLLLFLPLSLFFSGCDLEIPLEEDELAVNMANYVNLEGSRRFYVYDENDNFVRTYYLQYQSRDNTLWDQSDRTITVYEENINGDTIRYYRTEQGAVYEGKISKEYDDTREEYRSRYYGEVQLFPGRMDEGETHEYTDLDGRSVVVTLVEYTTSLGIENVTYKDILQIKEEIYATDDTVTTTTEAYYAKGEGLIYKVVRNWTIGTVYYHYRQPESDSD